MHTPDKIHKLYYRITEVAEIFSLKTSAIRYWCDEFGIETERDRKNHRVFRSQDIVKIKYLYFLIKTKGLTLKGAALELSMTGWIPESYMEERIAELRLKHLRIRTLKKAS